MGKVVVVGYFSDNYEQFRYPLQTDGAPGFRVAQLGAIHAAAAHFAVRNEPGITTMPTGSGKTAVLVAAAFVLRAERVLVITPSRLVREQIADEISNLATLKAAGALPADLAPPRVFGTKKRITTAEEWEKLRNYDVVVGTIPSISPEYPAIPQPPPDLFDVVLVDEAHHSPARTWQSVLDHFPNAKRLLFTATPFRQDQREIKGRFLFTYDLKRAFDDGIFGEISYQPVTPLEGENHDVAIARAASLQFAADRAAGHRHHVMVRTDSKRRASELLSVYADNTNLRLRLVTGDKSLKYLRTVIEQLQNDELDGIVCVNMMGEGFNFPSLKIAAIHSPHKSLSVTLQFIGRFARTVGDDIGSATFLAIPSEIEIEAERLYDARAVWQEMVQNLSATRVEAEAETREVLESFAAAGATSPDLADLSLYILEPYHHVKMYQLDRQIDIRTPLEFPPDQQVVYESVSEAHNAVVYITREVQLPRWTTDDRLSAIKYELFVIYQHPISNLLFVCASQRSEGLYEQLMAAFQAANPRPLALVRLNRALNDLQAPEFFNVGMRNRVASNTTESYRIITGSNADKAILRGDGRLYHRGHAFGRASDQGELVTIGLSSASKIWSNKSSKLPELIEWCEKLARKLSSDHSAATGSGLDFLDVGEEIEELPPDIIAASWPVSVFRNPPMIRFQGATGPVSAQLLDLDVQVDLALSDAETVVVVLTHSAGLRYAVTFSFHTDRFFELASANEPEVLVERDREAIELIHFLNGEPLQFHTANLSMVHGNSLLRPPSDAPVLDQRAIETRDWAAANVDIQREFGVAAPGRLSIHAGLEEELRNSDAAVVYYDHGTGEIADFIAITEEENGVLIQFFHCKGSGAAVPGHRLADVYEIASQTVKSVVWALKQRILGSIRRRFSQNIGGHRFVRGDLPTLEEILGRATPAQIRYEFVAVQPGLRKTGLPAEFANVLGAASDHLVRSGFLSLKVLASE